MLLGILCCSTLMLIIGEAEARVITPGTNLTPLGSQYWESTDGKFGLGFFRPSDASPDRNYVGIVYLQDGKPSTPPVAVWVANRDRPASINSSLNLTASSGLVILDSGQVVWQSGTGLSVTEAEMLNVGNFVLRSASLNASNVTWESFNFPTDTLLPGQKQMNQVLSSWTTKTDPTPGHFSLRLDRVPDDVTGRLVYLNTIEYWLSSAGSGEFIFTGEQWNLSASYCSSRVIASLYVNYSERLTLDTDGNLRYYVKPPASPQWRAVWRALYRPCFVYNTCGDNGFCNFDVEPQAPGNCSLSDELKPCSCPRSYSWVDPSEMQLGCRAAEDISCPSKFLLEERAAFEDLSPAKTADFTNLIDAQACLARCTGLESVNASCNAAVYSALTRECWLVSSPLVNGSVSANSGKVVYVRTPVCSGLSAGVKAGIGVGAAVGTLLLLCLVTLLYRLSRKKIVLRKGVWSEGGLLHFSYDYLKYVTNNFSQVLGFGGFGTVVLGVLPTGERVAVKVLNEAAKQENDKNFVAELKSLAGIGHQHVVRLIGFCSEGTKRILVYEYVVNGSLDKQLFHSTTVLTSYKSRMDILVGAAEGMKHIHLKSIIHRDIKPANILLDEDYNAKVADFGLAKIIEATHATNFTLGGTVGYKAPECGIIGEAITMKADVFSFGVMCIEAILGRQLVYIGQEDGRTMLFRVALQLMQVGDYHKLVDERLVDVEHDNLTDMEKVAKVMRIAGWCLQAQPKDRPSMETVVTMLKEDHVVPVPPLEGLPSYLFSDVTSVDSFSLPTGTNSSMSGR